MSRLQWRSALRDRILPALVEFNPDLILLSAGFDAHKKENVNWGYIALLEQDYEWLVHKLKRVAATCCHGRLVSVLEGGYNFHGRMVSPFARSVAAHCRALVLPSREPWLATDMDRERQQDETVLTSLRPAAVPPVSSRPHQQEHQGGVDGHLPLRKRSARERHASDTHKQEVPSPHSTTETVKAVASSTPSLVKTRNDLPPVVVVPVASVAHGRSKRARKDVDYVALAKELGQ